MNSLWDTIQECGFELAGFTLPKIQEKDRINISEFIQKKFFATMDWFPDRQNIRVEFQDLGFNVQSVLMLGCVYNPGVDDDNSSEWKNKIAKYAWGNDYHKVLKNKAKPILNFLKAKYPYYKFRQGVDSLPLAEKILARDANLGWIGKNTLLINSDLGSYFFLTAILCENIPDEYQLDSQLINLEKDRCGTCTACIDACPTKAIVAPYQLDANKCISHHTIEFKGGKFEEGMETHGWVFGCDICQDVCPWNRVKARKKKVQYKEPSFAPLTVWNHLKKWKNPTEEEFMDEFKNSPILRTGIKSWRRNIEKAYQSDIE